MLECAIEIYGNGFSDNTLTTFCEGLTGVFLSRGSSDFFNAPLWFVLCLFLVEIIYFFVCKLKPYFIVAVCIPLVFLGWFLESEHFIYENKLLPWSIDSALFALGFYAMGNLMSAKTKKYISLLSEHKDKYLICAGIIIVALAAGIPLAMANGKVSLGSKILNNGFIFYATGIIGTVLVVCAGIMLRKSRFLAWCGQNSFYIMAVHYLCRVLLRYVYKFFDVPVYDKTSLKETIFPFVVVWSASVLIAFCYGKLKMFCMKQTRKK